LNWLDQLTRAVIIDFSLYNANVNLFVAVTLSFEMTSIGSVIQDHQIKIFRLYDHIGGYGVLVYIFELMFVIFTIYSVIHEIVLLVKQRDEYFRKFWNIISFLTAIFSITTIAMYGTKKTLTRLAIRSLRKTEMDEFINFNAIASFDEVYSYIVALITFFTMLKFLKLLRFNKRIGILSKSFRYARRDLSSFGFVFLIFILAYAQMGFAIFGRSLRVYRNFFISLTTCFRMLLGEVNAPDMFSVSRVYGNSIHRKIMMMI
jgi:polycystin 1L2